MRQKSPRTRFCVRGGFLSVFVKQAGKIEGREIILRRLGAADELCSAVLAEENLRRAELAVVVVAHREAVRAGIVQDDEVAHIDFREHPVNREFVVVLAQAARHVVLVVAGGVLLAHNGDVMVRAVHGGAHQVGGAGVEADVLLVDVLLVDGRRHEAAVRGKHIAAKLREDGDVAHPGRDEHLLVRLPDALADGGDVDRLLIRAVRDADAAGEVYEFDFRAGLLPELDGEREQDARERRVILVRRRVAREEGVNAELLGAKLHEAAVTLDHLLLREAVFRVAGVVHDAVGNREISAGVQAAADELRNGGDVPEEVNVRQVVEVDRRVQPSCELKVLRRGVVRGEHDVRAGEAARLGHHQLREGGAVDAAALLLQDLEDKGVRRGLHGEILAKARIPRKRRLEGAGAGADALLVIQMERRGILLHNLPELLLIHKKLFFHRRIHPFLRDSAEKVREELEQRAGGVERTGEAAPPAAAVLLPLLLLRALFRSLPVFGRFAEHGVCFSIGIPLIQKKYKKRGASCQDALFSKITPASEEILPHR